MVSITPVARIETGTADACLTPQGVVDRVKALKPWLLEQATAIEEAGRIPDEVADRLAATGVFRLTMPAKVGGFGAHPQYLWDAIDHIGQACASCAWITALNGSNMTVMGKFSDQAQHELFDGQARTITAVLTGGVLNRCDITLVDGGMRLSGEWRYASGIDIVPWVGLLVPIPRADGPPRPHLVLVPRASFAIDHDSWKVVGMKGTGSKVVQLTDEFVPVHRWMAWDDLVNGIPHPDCTVDEPDAKLPLNLIFAQSLAAPPIGVAAGIVDAFEAVIRNRVSAGTKEKQIDDPASRDALSRCRARLDMLRQSLRADTERLYDDIVAGRELDQEYRAGMRMRYALLAQECLAITQVVFSSIGGAMLPAPSRLERGLRDIHGLTTHFLLQPGPMGDIYGRILLGLDLPPSARL